MTLAGVRHIFEVLLFADVEGAIHQERTRETPQAGGVGGGAAGPLAAKACWEQALVEPVWGVPRALGAHSRPACWGKSRTADAIR